MRNSVFVSVTDDRNLDEERMKIKRAILRKLADTNVLLKGFEQEQYGLGLPSIQESWTPERALKMLQTCDGMVVLALARCENGVFTNGVPLPTVYNHLEGAFALALNKPLLLLREQGMKLDGIFASGIKCLEIPNFDWQSWIQNVSFANGIKTWRESITVRRDVFLGYCSKGSVVALQIREFIESHGYQVLDWSRDFDTGRFILDEIERSASACRTGIFLFTKDDELAKSAMAKAGVSQLPRDNVVLEAGYFTRQLGNERVAIIREAGTKMPSDFGGIIYEPFDDRSQLDAIKQRILRFLEKNVGPAPV